MAPAAVAIVALVMAMSSPVSAHGRPTRSDAARAAELSITIDVLDAVYRGGPVDARIDIANTGSDDLQQLDVQQVRDGCSSTVSGPTVTTGNDDPVLEPGERWEYRCSAASVIVPHIEVDVVAEVVGGGQVSRTAQLSYELRDPVRIDIAARSTTTGPVGTWPIRITNVSNATFVDVVVESRLLFPGWTGPIPFVTAIGPSPGGNDVVFGPGESWEYVASWQLVVAESSLDVSVGAGPSTNPAGRVGVTARSDALSLPVAPTTTVATTGSGGGSGLPGTGGSMVLLLVAVAATEAGIVMRRLTRRA